MSAIAKDLDEIEFGTARVSMFTHPQGEGERAAAVKPDLAVLARPIGDPGFLPPAPDPNRPRLPPTGPAAVGSDGDAAARAKASRYRSMFGNSWYAANPSAKVVDIKAERDEAAAHGFFYVLDRAFYNLVDEVVRKSTTISGAYAKVFAQIQAREDGFEVVDEGDEEAIAWRDAAQKYICETKSHFGWIGLKRALSIEPKKAGHCIVEIQWDVRDGLTVPLHYKHRHPGMFAYDEDANLYYVADRAGQAGVVEPVPPGKFCNLIIPAAYASPYGDSEVYKLRFDWFFAHEGEKFWLRWSDKYGTPLPIAKWDGTGVPPGEAGVAETTRRRDELIEALEGLAEDMGLILPPEASVEFAQRAASGSSPHESITAYYESKITRFILGSNLAVMESKEGSGSRAMSQTHAETMGEQQKPHAALMAETINRDILEPFLLFNFGPKAVGRVRYFIDLDEGEDVDANIKIFAEARAAKVDVSLSQYREKLGLEQPRDEADTLRAPEPPPQLMAPGLPGEEPGKPPAKPKDDDPEEKEEKEEKGDSKFSEILIDVPEAVCAAAREGCNLRARFARGGTEMAMNRAALMVARRSVPLEFIQRMHSYFERHKADRESPHWDDAKPPNARIAWMLWGGDAGRDWAAEMMKGKQG